MISSTSLWTAQHVPSRVKNILNAKDVMEHVRSRLYPARQSVDPAVAVHLTQWYTRDFASLWRIVPHYVSGEQTYVCKVSVVQAWGQMHSTG